MDIKSVNMWTKCLVQGPRRGLECISSPYLQLQNVDLKKDEDLKQFKKIFDSIGDQNGTYRTGMNFNIGRLSTKT